MSEPVVISLSRESAQTLLDMKDAPLTGRVEREQRLKAQMDLYTQLIAALSEDDQ